MKIKKKNVVAKSTWVNPVVSVKTPTPIKPILAIIPVTAPIFAVVVLPSGLINVGYTGILRAPAMIIPVLKMKEEGPTPRSLMKSKNTLYP